MPYSDDVLESLRNGEPMPCAPANDDLPDSGIELITRNDEGISWINFTLDED